MTAFKPGKPFVCTSNQEKLTRKCAVHQCARIGPVKNCLQKLKIVVYFEVLSVVNSSLNMVSWTDSVVFKLLEALKSRKSLWNTSITKYKNKNKKKTEYDELLELLKDDVPNLNLAALKGTVVLCCIHRHKFTGGNIISIHTPDPNVVSQ